MKRNTYEIIWKSNIQNLIQLKEKAKWEGKWEAKWYLVQVIEIKKNCIAFNVILRLVCFFKSKNLKK